MFLPRGVKKVSVRRSALSNGIVGYGFPEDELVWCQAPPSVLRKVLAVPEVRLASS